MIATLDGRVTDKDAKKRHDILTCRLDSDADFVFESADCPRVHEMIYLDDTDPAFADVLARLQAKASKGDAHPVIAYPFCIMEDRQGEDGFWKRIMATPSVYRFDESLMSEATAGLLGTTKAALEDRQTVTPILLKKKSADDPGRPFTAADLIHDETHRR
jgi:hypothetical protein